MTRDPSKDDKKCGEANRIFDFEGKNAQKTDCLNECEKDKNCVAMSGQWVSPEEWIMGNTNQWCIGCKVPLTTSHNWAEAFKKDK